MSRRSPGPIWSPARAAVAVLGAIALTGCSLFSDRAEHGPGARDDRLTVVASCYPVEFLADWIGGDEIEVTSLTQPGQEPHDLEISARQRARLERSDVALYVKGLQPSVDEAIRQSPVRTKLDVTTLTSVRTRERTGDRAADGARSAHGATDPHVWLDPVRYAEIAQGVGKALEKADPRHAATYRKTTGTLVKKLRALHTRYEDGLKAARGRVLLTTHAAFGYLAERYGLTQRAIAGLDPESEPSAARIRELRRTAREDHVTTVFYETLVSGDTARTLAEDAHLRTDVLDPVEGITERSRGRDYLEVMEANLRALRKAFGLGGREGAGKPSSTGRPADSGDGDIGTSETSVTPEKGSEQAAGAR